MESQEPLIHNVIEAIQIALKIEKENPQQSIAIIEKWMEDPQFFPWGAFNLTRLYEQCGRVDEAVALNLSLFETDPSFLPAWEGYIRFARSTPLYYERMKQISEQVRQAEKIEPMWVQRLVMESIISAAPDNVAAYLAPAVAGGIFDHDQAYGIQIASEFVRDVRNFIAPYEDKDYTIPTSWTFRFYYNDVVCTWVGTCLHINLSRLELDRFYGWEESIVDTFVMAVWAAVQWAPYDDDFGITSWPHISKRDKFTSIFFHRVLLGLRQLGNKYRQVPRGIPHVSMSPGQLWVRAGNVEALALWNHLNDPEAARYTAEHVAERLLQDPESQKELANDPWWPCLSAEANITRMATNAGWYAKPSHAGAAFEDWATRYLDALCEGRLIATHDEYMLRLAALEPRFRHQVPHLWTDEQMMQALDGAHAVVVSAYADQIGEHYKSGHLTALWKDLGFSSQLASLRTVMAPMSVWPYYPQESWTHSFNELRENCAQAIQEQSATMFAASCGAYGLPLVHEMHKRFGILSIYYGHAINMFFGVKTNTAKTTPFFNRAPNSKHWVEGNLISMFPETKRIDNGRYAS